MPIVWWRVAPIGACSAHRLGKMNAGGDGGRQRDRAGRRDYPPTPPSRPRSTRLPMLPQLRGHCEWTPVRLAMTRDTVTVPPEMPVRQVMVVLVEHDFNS